MAKVTDMMVRKLKAKDKAYDEPLGNNLYVTVRPNGRKIFLLRYSTEGKRSKISLGEYPTLSLAQAMAEAEKKKILAKSVGNIYKAEQEEVQKQEQIAKIALESNFSVLIEKFMQSKVNFKEWTESHKNRQEMRINKYLLPIFKDKSINNIKIEEIHDCLHKIVSANNHETAKKIYRIIKGIYEYADDRKLLEDKNLSIITRLQRFARTLPKSEEKTRYQAMTDEEIGALMAKLAAYENGSLQVKIAAKIAPFIALRASEICKLEWEDVNFEAKEIHVPAHKMKMKKEHIVPLSRQAVELLKMLPQDSNFLFYSPRNKAKHITTAAINKVWRNLGYKSALSDEKEFCTHAVRGMFSTFLHEKNVYNSDIIEFQLAHAEKNIVKGKYNVTNPRSYIKERHTMMQDYANYLKELALQKTP